MSWPCLDVITFAGNRDGVDVVQTIIQPINGRGQRFYRWGRCCDEVKHTLNSLIAVGVI